jgi:hypothetical protein
MENIKDTRTNYQKIKDNYNAYLKAYQFFNKGSLIGVTPFRDFYIKKMFEIRYQESHNLFSVNR